jgi:hypothetical protein
VTYTNAPCQIEASAASPSVWKIGTRTKVVSTSDNLITKKNANHTAEPKKNYPHPHSFALDMTTLKAAQLAMQSNDQASSLSRQQKLAALDQNNRHWFSF